MELTDIRVFEAVARLGSMSRAANELNTVQSNVSSRIRALERELRTALFYRQGRGVTLTPAGARLLPYAERLRHVLADAHRAVTDSGQPSGKLLIGSLETTAAIRLPPVLESYVIAYPDVDLILRTGTTAELTLDVLERRLDGAFVCGPVEHPDLEEHPIFREELAIITAASVPRLEDLMRQPEVKIIVLRVGCSYRERLERILAKRGIVGLRRLEFGTIDAILGCVAAGLGLTLLPKSLVREAKHHPRLAVHEVKPTDSLVDTIFIRRRDAFMASALARFLEQARPTPIAIGAAE
jgi:LysR family transcriptional regulator, cell division regulator